MHCYGVRGTVHDWFRSYLCNRKQYTSLAGCTSPLSNINLGVPQGSVLGPLLFLIYINDIHNAVPDENIYLFADDSNLFIRGKTKTEIMATAAQCLSKLSDWFLANKLSLSLDKTCFTVFPASKSEDITISLGLNTLQRVHSCKYLGVIIDAELKWTEHIQYVFSKLIKYVGIFYKLRTKLPVYCLKSLYFAFVHPHLLYGIELYGNACSTHLEKLAKLNNKILRVLQAADIRTHVTELYAKFFTLPVNELYKLQMATVMHKFYHHIEILPGVFHNYFTRNSEVHRYSTRQQSDLHVCRVNSALGQRSLKIRGCSIWNGLPTSLKEPCSVKCFRSKLKRYLMTKFTEDN